MGTHGTGAGSKKTLARRGSSLGLLGGTPGGAEETQMNGKYGRQFTGH